MCRWGRSLNPILSISKKSTPAFSREHDYNHGRENTPTKITLNPKSSSCIHDYFYRNAISQSSSFTCPTIPIPYWLIFPTHSKMQSGISFAFLYTTKSCTNIEPGVSVAHISASYETLLPHPSPLVQKILQKDWHTIQDGSQHWFFDLFLNIFSSFVKFASANGNVQTMVY